MAASSAGVAIDLEHLKGMLAKNYESDSKNLVGLKQLNYFCFNTPVYLAYVYINMCMHILRKMLIIKLVFIVFIISAT